MPRIARVVIPHIPHHITQRGNRRQRTFFTDDDYAAYVALMAEHCRMCDVEIWAYCLMPNHIHLIAVPGTPDGLRSAIAEVHRRYTRRINIRERWRGHLWQERFASFPMDESHCLAAARYIELNPVRARFVERPEDWPWCSAAAHLASADDSLVCVGPLLEKVDDWPTFLTIDSSEGELETIRHHERTGRPLGGEAFVARLERSLGRRLAPQKPGRKPKERK